MEYLHFINSMTFWIGILFSSSLLVRARLSSNRSLVPNTFILVALSAIGFFATFFAASYVPFITDNNIPGVFIVLLAVATSFVPVTLNFSVWKPRYALFLAFGISIALSVLVPNAVFQETVLNVSGTPQFAFGPLAPFFFGSLVVYPLGGIILYISALRQTKDSVMRYVLLSLGIAHAIFAVYLILANVILPPLGNTKLLPYIAIMIIPFIIVANAVLPYIRRPRKR